MESMGLPGGREACKKHQNHAGSLLVAVCNPEDQKSPFLIISCENAMGKSMVSGDFG